MNYGMGGRTGFSSLEGSTRAILKNPTFSHRRFTGASNALGYIPDGDMGLGWSIKKPFGDKSSILNQITRVVTYPVRVVSAVALQTVGLKTLASKAGGQMISKNLLKSAGQVGQIAGAVVIGVAAAPAIGSAIGTAATGVGSVVSSITGAIGTATTAVGVALKTVTGGASTKEVLDTAKAAQDASKLFAGGKDGGSEQQAQPAQPSGANPMQAFYDSGVMDAKNNRPRTPQTDAEGEKYYTQGYNEMAKIISDQLAANAQAYAEEGSMNQASQGNDMTAVLKSAQKKVEAMTASMVDPESLKKIAMIAGPLLLLGFLFSGAHPAQAEFRSGKIKRR